jgi:PPE-repeat protein
MVGVAAGFDYGFLPPEINSGRIWAGPGSGALAASAAAWQALAAELGSAGAAMQAVVEALTGTSWLGPSSMTMAAAAAPYAVWMLAVAGQCEEAAAAASQAAMAFEAARAGVVPPAEIEENREQLRVLIGTNFPFNQNAAAIAATEADYDRMWSQDATVLYGYAADAAGVTGSLVPFVPPAPTANPAGFAAQAAAVAQAGGTGAGDSAQNAAVAGAQAAQLPGGLDAQAMLSMGPQLMGTIPQLLQVFAQPAMQGFSAPMQGLGGLQSLLSPFMGMLSNPGLVDGLGAAGPEALGVAAPALTGATGGTAGVGGAVSAGLGGAARIGGLSVPATWAASAPASAQSAAALSVTGAANPQVAPVTASSAGMGGAPVAAMAPRDSGTAAGGPRYGTPVRVLPRPR